MFEKISLEQFRKDISNLIFHLEWSEIEEDLKTIIDETYEQFKLPELISDSDSSFKIFNPFPELQLDSESSVIPLGIRWIGDDNSILILVPQTDLGLTYGLTIENNIGNIIDADYNKVIPEGHLICRIYAKEAFDIEEGQSFLKGIVLHK